MHYRNNCSQGARKNIMRDPRVEVEIGDLTFLLLFLQLFSSLRFISMIISREYWNINALYYGHDADSKQPIRAMSWSGGRVDCMRTPPAASLRVLPSYIYNDTK